MRVILAGHDEAVAKDLPQVEVLEGGVIGDEGLEHAQGDHAEAIQESGHQHHQAALEANIARCAEQELGLNDEENACEADENSYKGGFVDD